MNGRVEVSTALYWLSQYTHSTKGLPYKSVECAMYVTLVICSKTRINTVARYSSKIVPMTAIVAPSAQVHPASERAVISIGT